MSGRSKAFTSLGENKNTLSKQKVYSGVDTDQFLEPPKDSPLDKSEEGDVGRGGTKQKRAAFTEADDDALYDLLTKYRGSLKRASQAPEARWSHNAIRARIHYLRNVLKDPRFRGSFKQPRTNSEQALKNFYKVLKGHGRQRKEELLANERIATREEDESETVFSEFGSLSLDENATELGKEDDEPLSERPKGARVLPVLDTQTVAPYAHSSITPQEGFGVLPSPSSSVPSALPPVLLQNNNFRQRDIIPATVTKTLHTTVTEPTHIPDGYEQVAGEVKITTLTSQYSVVLDPIGESSRPQVGQKQLRKGETSFLRSGESLESGIQNAHVLGEEEALLLRAQELFVDGKEVHQPGDRWMIYGPVDYVPPTQVEIVEKRKAIPLDDNEGIYVRDFKSGHVRKVTGPTSYKLMPNEELWAKELPKAVEELLAKERTEGDRSHSGEGRDKTRVVCYRAPHNSAVQIYDYKEKKPRVVFGPSLVMLGPDEHFTVLSLSGDKPKRPHVIKALSLMLGPDFMTDVVVVETADHARLSLKLSYNWQFEVDKSKEKESTIFQVPDFVGDSCKAIASRVRGAVATVSFDNFHKHSVKIIRQAVFGVDEHERIRNHFAFSSNNLLITNIDIQSMELVGQSNNNTSATSVTTTTTSSTTTATPTTATTNTPVTSVATGSDKGAASPILTSLVFYPPRGRKDSNPTPSRVESTPTRSPKSQQHPRQATAEAKARAESAQISSTNAELSPFTVHTCPNIKPTPEAHTTAKVPSKPKAHTTVKGVPSKPKVPKSKNTTKNKENLPPWRF